MSPVAAFTGLGLLVSTARLLLILVELSASAASPSDVQRADLLPGCPRIVRRTEWRARNATSAHDKLPHASVPYVVVHHGGTPDYCYDEAACARTVRFYQNMHMDERGWIDIGYSFVVGEDGNVYEGRGWDYVGAHAPGYNTQSIGVCVIGDFTHTPPNGLALEALESLMECGVRSGKISGDYRVIGHRQARPTLCPGELLYDRVRKMPRWTPEPVPVYGDSSASPFNGTRRAADPSLLVLSARTTQKLGDEGLSSDDRVIGIAVIDDDSEDELLDEPGRSDFPIDTPSPSIKKNI